MKRILKFIGKCFSSVLHPFAMLKEKRAQQALHEEIRRGTVNRETVCQVAVLSDPRLKKALSGPDPKVVLDALQVPSPCPMPWDGRSETTWSALVSSATARFTIYPP